MSKNEVSEQSSPSKQNSPNEQNELTYTQNGDYLIPDLSLSGTQTTPIGKYGRMRRTYLQQNRPILYNRLILSEKLYPHLTEIDQTANERLERLMDELTKQNGVTEKLKADDPMEWVRAMNSLKAQAEETILTELIFS